MSTLEKQNKSTINMDMANDTQYLLSCEEYKSGLKYDLLEHSLENMGENVSFNIQYHKPTHDMTLRESITLIGQLTKQIRSFSNKETCPRCHPLSMEVSELKNKVAQLYTESEELMADHRDSLENFKRYHEEIMDKRQSDFETQLKARDTEISSLKQSILDIKDRRQPDKTKHLQPLSTPKYTGSPSTNKSVIKSIPGVKHANKLEQLNNLTLADLEEGPQVIVSPKPNSKCRLETNLGFYSDDEVSDFHSYMKDAYDNECEISESSLKRPRCGTKKKKLEGSKCILEKGKKVGESVISKREKSIRKSSRPGVGISKDGCGKAEAKKRVLIDLSSKRCKLKQRPIKDEQVFAPSAIYEANNKRKESSILKTFRKKSVRKNSREPKATTFLKKNQPNKENLKPYLLQMVAQNRDNKNLLF